MIIQMLYQFSKYCIHLLVLKVLLFKAQEKALDHFILLLMEGKVGLGLYLAASQASPYLSVSSAS